MFTFVRDVQALSLVVPPYIPGSGVGELPLL